MVSRVIKRVLKHRLLMRMTVFVWMAAAATPVGAETIELVTYYPSQANTGDLHVRSLTVGDGYRNENPADGEVLVFDRLGIGTAAPAGPLHVVGVDGGPSNVLFMPGTGGTLNMGIGTDNPRSTLHVVSPTNGNQLRLGNTGQDFTQINFEINDTEVVGMGADHRPGFEGAVIFNQALAAAYRRISFRSNGNVDDMVINNGNVGIGTTVPASLLQVVGGEIVSGSTDPGQANIAVGVNNIQARAGAAPSNLALNALGSNVGIGTNNPVHRLRVVGGPRWTRAGWGGSMELNNGTAIAWNKTGGAASPWHYGMGHTTSGFYLFRTASAPGNAGSSPNYDLYIGNDGHVQIGGTNSVNPYMLDVNGTAHATSHPSSSDIRFKTGVAELTGVLGRLGQIRGVSFDWNKRYESLGRSTGHREIGLIAQEVEGAFPELVTTWGDEHYRAIDYGRFTAVLLQAVKELKEENDDLKRRMEKLEATSSAR